MAENSSSYVLGREDMRRLDAFTIESGSSSIELMERAGRSVASFCAEKLGSVTVPLHAAALEARARSASPDAFGLLVVAGPGNNGGDGFVAARALAEQGWRVTVALGGAEPPSTSDCGVNAERWSSSGGRVIDRSQLLALLAGEAENDFDLILDALFGTGLDRPLEAGVAELVESINRCALPVIAVDMPSGLCADSGRPLGTAIRAAATLAIGAAQPGLFLDCGPDFAGRVSVADIGLADPRSAGLVPCGELLDAHSAAALLPSRRRSAHKGELGHILIVGASLGRSGAVLLAARAALRSGAGLVTMAVPASLARHCDAALSEAMTLELADDGTGSVAEGAYQAIEATAAGLDVVLLGPGLGRSQAAALLANQLLSNLALPLVIDADAISIFASDGNAFARRLRKRRQAGLPRVIVTPHPGEMARVLASSPSAVQRNRIAATKAFDQRNDALLVLKGAGTLVSSGKRLAFNTSGNPGMAAAGMGDVLGGVIAALLAVTPDAFDAARLGVHVHGLAADILEEKFEGPGFFASEVADAIPEALAQLRQGRR